ncbi:MAG: hypothetical protein IKA56_01450 [Clostridia bacterium]|nr:hypothetical protein [Clostridia bacterium]
MENYEQFYENEAEEYYESRRESRDYLLRVTLCQLILSALIVGGLFGMCRMSDEFRAGFSEGIEYLQRGDLTEEIQAAKDLFGIDAQI